MVKKKTSINIDNDVWKDWMKFVIDKTGSVRKLSEEMESALQEYMGKHG
jgi:hypothetical protein